MELRFLSAKMDDLVDPDAGAIREAIGRLSKSSGDNPPRAVLVHDNGKDFIQFVAKTKGGDPRNCLVQYCEHQGDGTGFSQHCSTRDRTKEEVIELFQAYAAGDPEWKDKISWEPAKRTRSHSQYVRLGCILSIGLMSFGVGALLMLLFVIEGSPERAAAILGAGLLSVALICSSFLLWIRPARLGAPWAGVESPTGSGGGAEGVFGSAEGCGSGSCGGGGIKSGGGGGRGGSGGGGGSCGGDGGGGGGGGGGCGGGGG